MKIKKTHFTLKKSMSLVQVMVGVMILACGLIPLIGIFTQSGVQVAKSQWALIAESLGRSYIDQLKKAEYNADSLEPGTDDFKSVTSTDGMPFKLEGDIAYTGSDAVNGFPEYYSMFQRRIVVEELEASRLKKIHLTIKWKENEKGEEVFHYLNFCTFVCNTRVYVYH